MANFLRNKLLLNTEELDACKSNGESALKFCLRRDCCQYVFTIKYDLQLSTSNNVHLAGDTNFIESNFTIDK